MRSKPQREVRPRVEELEGRLVPSALATSSTNWSGYAVTAGRGAVTAVSGSWVVPSVTGSGTAYSSDWVGIDGYSSSTVEQIGTDSDLTNGTPQYYAWYEMYPRGSVTVPLAIHAGDNMSASVTYGGTGFTLSLTDVTSGHSYTTTQMAAGVQRSSAEWVVEAPSSGFGILPLANFGKVGFTSAQATVSGTRGPIDDTAWTGGRTYQINMTSQRGTQQDTTSALTDSGTPTTSSFTVTYSAAATTPTPAPRPRGWGGWGWWGWRNPDQTVAPTTTTNGSAAALASALTGSATAGTVTPIRPASSLASSSMARPSSVAAQAAANAVLAGARHAHDNGDVTVGRADQPAGPEQLPAPVESGEGAAPPAGSDAPAPPTMPATFGPTAPGQAIDGDFMELASERQAAIPPADGGESDQPTPQSAGLRFLVALGGALAALQQQGSARGRRQTPSAAGRRR
jgi:hypothetical protein